MDNRLQVRAVSAPWARGVELLVKQGRSVGVNVQMEEMKDGYIHRPTLEIENMEAQTLMDDLWNSGFRPTEGAGSAGAMRAVQEHVNDLRKITFNVLKIGE